MQRDPKHVLSGHQTSTQKSIRTLHFFYPEPSSFVVCCFISLLDARSASERGMIRPYRTALLAHYRPQAMPPVRRLARSGSRHVAAEEV